MVGMVRAKDCKVSLLDIFDTRSYKLGSIEGPSVWIGRWCGASGYSHDIMLVVHVVVFKLDGIWVDYIFLIDNDFLHIMDSCGLCN